MKREVFLVGCAALGALAFGGCASLDGVAPPVTPALLQAGRGAAPATLEEGRRIFTTACAACHRLDPPRKYSGAEWRQIVADMAERSKLTAGREAALLAYLDAARSLPAGPR